jgi:hypothetical protein
MSEINYQAFPQHILEVEIAWADRNRDEIIGRRDALYLELGRRIIGDDFSPMKLYYEDLRAHPEKYEPRPEGPGFEIVWQSPEADIV